MLDAIESIGSYTAAHDLESFRKDQRTVDAVVFRLVVIGEAASALPETVRNKHSELPWDRIRGMRNVVVHEYSGIRVDTVWQTIREDLPPLVALLEEMLVGDLETAVGHAPQSDLDILGARREIDLEFVRRMVQASRSSCLFTSDSGQESALA